MVAMLSIERTPTLVTKSAIIGSTVVRASDCWDDIYNNNVGYTLL